MCRMVINKLIFNYVGYFQIFQKYSNLKGKGPSSIHSILGQGGNLKRTMPSKTKNLLFDSPNSYGFRNLCKGPFKYYVIMILTFFDPPTHLNIRCQHFLYPP